MQRSAFWNIFYIFRCFISRSKYFPEVDKNLYIITLKFIDTNNVRWNFMCVWFFSKQLGETFSGRSHLTSGNRTGSVCVQQSPGKTDQYICRMIKNIIWITVQSICLIWIKKLTWLLYLVRTVSIIFANFTDFVNWGLWLTSCSVNCVNISSFKSGWEVKQTKNRQVNDIWYYDYIVLRHFSHE